MKKILQTKFSIKMLSFEIPPRPLNLLRLVSSPRSLPDSQIRTIHSIQYSMIESLHQRAKVDGKVRGGFTLACTYLMMG